MPAQFAPYLARRAIVAAGRYWWAAVYEQITNHEDALKMTDSAPGASPSPIVSVGLREGGDLAFYPDRIVSPGGTFAPGELTAAYIAVAPDLPPLPDGRPVPAIALRLRDGSYRTLVPADPPDAGRFLEALYAPRPDLRPGYTGYQAPPPPGAFAVPPGFAAPPPAGYGYGYAPYGPYPPYPPYAAPMHPSGVPDGDRTLAGLTHLSVFFASIIMPLIVWLVTRTSMPYASRQAKQAFFFQLILGGISLVLILPFYFAMFASVFALAPNNPGAAPAAFFGGFALVWVLILALSGVRIGFGIYAAVQAFQGKPYHYPLLGGLR